VSPRDGGVTTAGVCGPRPVLGEACDYDRTALDPCRPNLSQSCLDGVCRELTPFMRPAGAECPIRGYGRVAAPFFGFAICQTGLTCQPSTSAHAPSTGRCATARPVGAPCTDDHFRAPRLTCAPSPDGGMACSLWPLLGQPCRSLCRRDALCEPEGDGGFVCRPLHALDAGCIGFSQCVPGATCIDNTCTLGAVGQPCTYGHECGGGACQANQCVAMCLR